MQIKMPLYHLLLIDIWCGGDRIVFVSVGFQLSNGSHIINDVPQMLIKTTHMGAKFEGFCEQP